MKSTKHTFLLCPKNVWESVFKSWVKPSFGICHNLTVQSSEAEASKSVRKGLNLISNILPVCPFISFCKDAVYQRGNDGGKRGADDHTYCKVYHVALEREGFKLIPKLFHKAHLLRV